MDGGLLSQITALFRDASLIWGPTIAGIIEPWWYSLLIIGWFFMIFPVVFGNHLNVVGALIQWFILQGFLLSMIRYGTGWIDQLFNSIKTLAYMLGAPPLDPSAVASFGVVVSDPIMKSLAAQGFLSYMTNPATYIFAFAGLGLIIAFVLLGLMLMGTLILSYLLTAACPFFMLFAATSYTRGMTEIYVKLIMGTLATLFIIMLITCQVSEIAALLHGWTTSKFLVTGVTLTWSDYAAPIGVAVVLCSLFVWLPVRIGRAAYGFVPDWSMGLAVAGSAIRGASLATNAVSIPSSGAGSSSAGRGGSGQQSLAAPQQGMSSGASQAQPLGASPWGKKP